jgi:acyl carrier protein phosphodiesterase
VNYLAHSLLGGDDPDLLVGGLLGDFVKGPIPDSLAPGLARGVRLHRAVDAYSDHHPTFRRSVARVPHSLRRYGPIVIDVYYDHLLARDWEHHDGRSLEEFAGYSYGLLSSRLAAFPPATRVRISAIIEADLLLAYRQPGTVFRALQCLGQRLRRPVDLPSALPSLCRQDAELREDFAIFFPALRQHCLALLGTWE